MTFWWRYVVRFSCDVKQPKCACLKTRTQGHRLKVRDARCRCTHRVVVQFTSVPFSFSLVLYPAYLVHAHRTIFILQYFHCNAKKTSIFVVSKSKLLGHKKEVRIVSTMDVHGTSDFWLKTVCERVYWFAGIFLLINFTKSWLLHGIFLKLLFWSQFLITT